MSLDGKIATAAGNSRWITSPASRERAHRLRSENDAVIVGLGTVVADAPRLTARYGRAGFRQPTRVILDSRLKADETHNPFRERAGGPVLVYHTGAPRRRIHSIEGAGAVAVKVPEGRSGVRLKAVLADLTRRGIQAALVEGGPTVGWSFLREKLIDRVALFMAPVFLGGQQAKSVIGGEGIKVLGAAFQVSRLQIEPVGRDLLLTGLIES